METMTTATFEYRQSLKKAWSLAFNAEENKPKLVPGTGQRYTNGKTETYTFQYRVKGVLKAEHFMLYNVLRGKPLHRGFSTTSPHGFEEALHSLQWAVKSYERNTQPGSLERLLQPFGDQVDPKQTALAILSLGDIKTMSEYLEHLQIEKEEKQEEAPTLRVATT